MNTTALITGFQTGWCWKGPLEITQSKPCRVPRAVAQGHTQAGLGCLQRRRIHSSSGQPGQCSATLQEKIWAAKSTPAPFLMLESHRLWMLGNVLLSQLYQQPHPWSQELICVQLNFCLTHEARSWFGFHFSPTHEASSWFGFHFWSHTFV